jgi:hypothetical protein
LDHHRDEPSAAQVVPQKIPLVPLLVPPLRQGLHAVMAVRHVDDVQNMHYVMIDCSKVHTLSLCCANGKGTPLAPPYGTTTHTVRARLRGRDPGFRLVI